MSQKHFPAIIRAFICDPLGQAVDWMAAFRGPGTLPRMLAGILGGLQATWVTVGRCFVWIFVGAPSSKCCATTSRSTACSRPLLLRSWVSSSILRSGTRCIRYFGPGACPRILTSRLTHRYRQASIHGHSRSQAAIFVIFRLKAGDPQEPRYASAEPINLQRVAWELSPRLPEMAIVTSDSGSCANWYVRDLKIRRGMMCSLSGGLASMGAAVPYAIAAKFAYPDRPVIALVGDGAMQMNNMAELITVAKYWREWENPCWVCAVFNNPASF